LLSVSEVLHSRHWGQRGGCQATSDTRWAGDWGRRRRARRGGASRGAQSLASSTTARSSNAATVGFGIGDTPPIGFTAAEHILGDVIEAPVADEASHLWIVFFYLPVVSRCIYQLEVYGCAPHYVQP
jgi:hypothetical protein